VTNIGVYSVVLLTYYYALQPMVCMVTHNREKQINLCTHTDTYNWNVKAFYLSLWMHVAILIDVQFISRLISFVDFTVILCDVHVLFRVCERCSLYILTDVNIFFKELSFQLRKFYIFREGLFRITNLLKDYLNTAQSSYLVLSW
jgi:hypothetical protein